MLIGVCFVRSENEYAYHELCTTLSSVLHGYTQVNFVPRFCITDHSNAIAKGVEDAWSGITILTCWPHLVRNLKRNMNRLKENTLDRINVITSHVYFLHYLPNKASFVKLAKVALYYWNVSMHECEFATWFESTYLANDRWSGWYIGASGVAGIIANNNALESAQ